MGKKKLPPPQIVNVSVTSDIPEFKNYSIQNGKAHVNETWVEVLEKYQITLNPTVYCLKSPKKPVFPLVTDKIGEYVAQYKSKPRIYRVEIKYLSDPIVRACIDTMLARQPKRKRIPKRIGNAASSNKSVFPNRPKNYLLSRPGKTKEYEEDVWGYIRPEPTIDSNHDQDDLIDAASMVSQESQDSQDSQDPGDNIKAVILDKLGKQLTNGYMHLIRKELKSLKESQRTMKVSRYIPITLNMLQNIFAE